MMHRSAADGNDADGGYRHDHRKECRGAHAVVDSHRAHQVAHDSREQRTQSGQRPHHRHRQRPYGEAEERPITIKTVGVLRQVAHHATGETHIGHLGLVLGHKLCYQSVIIVCHIHYVLNNRPSSSFHARDAT